MTWKRGRIGPDAVVRPNPLAFSLKGSIGKIESPNSTSFFKRYVEKNRPVLIRGALDQWPALKKWTDIYLAEKAGDCQLEVITSTNGLFPDYETKPETMSKTLMSLKEILTIIGGLPKVTRPDQALYVYGKPCLFQQVPAFLNDIPTPAFLSEIKTNPVVLWLSSPGCITPLHYDLINGILCQVRGRKMVYFFSPDQDKNLYPRGGCFPGLDNFERQSSIDIHFPDLNKYPAFEDVTGQECLLEPGDILFIPSNWYHEVETLEDSISIGYNFSGGTATSDFAAMADALKMGTLDMTSIQQQLSQNPKMIEQLIKIPVFQQIMANPQMLQELMNGIKK